MPRYAKPNQTIDDLKKKLVEIADQIESDEEDVLESDGYLFLQDLLTERRDIWKEIFDACSFDYSNTGWANSGNENLPMLRLEPFEMVNGVPVAWCCAANDCEPAIVFVLYIGDDGDLHSYLPSDGNYFNKKDKCPWTDDDVDDDGEMPELGEARKYNVGKLREDVKMNINVK